MCKLIYLKSDDGFFIDLPFVPKATSSGFFLIPDVFSGALLIAIFSMGKRLRLLLVEVGAFSNDSSPEFPVILLGKSFEICSEKYPDIFFNPSIFRVILYLIQDRELRLLLAPRIAQRMCDVT